VTLFIVFHIAICVFLVVVILLQPGKSDAGIGFGSSSQSIFGSKGAGNFLTKTTSVCAIVFLLTSLVLTRSRIADQRGIRIDNVSTPAAPPSTDTPKVNPAPTEPAAKTDTAAPAPKAAAPTESKKK